MKTKLLKRYRKRFKFFYIDDDYLTMLDRSTGIIYEPMFYHILTTKEELHDTAMALLTGNLGWSGDRRERRIRLRIKQGFKRNGR